MRPTSIRHTRDMLEDRAALSVSETADVFALSRSTVYNRVKDGTIPSRRIGGRIVIPADAVRALLAGDAA